MTQKSGPIKSLEELKPALQVACLRHDVALAYLYGSQARSTAGPLSDVDVAVLFRPELPSDERFRQLLAVMRDSVAVYGTAHRRWDIWPSPHDDSRKARPLWYRVISFEPVWPRWKIILTC